MGWLLYFPRFVSCFVGSINDYFAPAMDGHLMEALRHDGYTLPAVGAAASFTSPLRAGETVHIETTVTGGTSSMTIVLTLCRPTSDQVASGEVTFVLVDPAFEPAPLPEAVQDYIRDRGDAVEA